MTYIAQQPYIEYQPYKAYQIDMKTLALERYFSFSYIERSFPIIYRRKKHLCKDYYIEETFLYIERNDIYRKRVVSITKCI